MGTSGRSWNPERTSDARKRVYEQPSAGSSFSLNDTGERLHPVISGALTALQAVIFALLLTTLPVLITSVISTTLVDQDFNFRASFAFGIKTWLLALGAEFAVGGQALSLVPVGLTVLVVWLYKLSVHRLLDSSWAAIISYLVFGQFLPLITALALGNRYGLRSALTTFVVSAVSVYFGLRRRPDAASIVQKIRSGLNPRNSVLGGVTPGGGVTTAALIFISILTTLSWVYLGSAAIGEVLRGWSLDGPSGVALGFLQALFLPTLGVYALGWLSGEGFYLGTHATVAPENVDVAILPNFPLLGAVPQEAVPSSFLVFYALLLVSAGILGGVRSARIEVRYRWWSYVTVPGLQTVVTGLSVILLFWLSTGEIGGGAALKFGVDPWSATLRVMLWVFIGALAGVCIARSETHHLLKRFWSTLRKRGDDMMTADPDQNLSSSSSAFL